MALDLSGFTIPEQKFEGLYKLGEELAAQRKAEAAAKAAEAKAAKDAAKELKANQAANLMWLKNATDPKAYLTGAPTDSEIIDLFAEAFQKGNQLQLENEGMSTSQLAQAMSPYISNLAQQGIISKNANKAITDATAKLNPKYYDINRANELLRQSTFYKKDEKGNLVKRDLSEVQLTPDLFQNALKEYGSEIVNSQSVVDALRNMKAGSKEITVPLKGGGKTTIMQSYAPWQQITDDGRVVPREEIALDTDESGKRFPMLLNGEQIKIVPDDVYNTIVSSKPEAEDWLNSQLHLYAPKFGLDINDTTSPQAMIFKKKLLYDTLNPLSSGDVKKATTIPAPKTSVGRGSSADRDKEQKRTRLADTLNNRNVDAGGYIDVTDIFPGYKYGKKSFGRNGVKYNPDTQKFKLTVIDEDGSTSEEEKPFNEVVTILQGSNSDKNLDFLDGFLEAKPRTKSAKGTKGTKNKIF